MKEGLVVQFERNSAAPEVEMHLEHLKVTRGDAGAVVHSKLRTLWVVVVTALVTLILAMAIEGWRQRLESSVPPAAEAPITETSTISSDIVDIGYYDGLSAARRGDGYDVDGSAAFEELMRVMGLHELPEGIVGRVVEIYHMAYAAGYVDGIKPE